MSASQRTPLAVMAHSNASATTKSQLNYDEILELLNKGLVDFLACFADSDERSNKFKVAFSSSLINDTDKKHFNHFGTLIIKAAYPDILKLSLTEKDILQKMAILSTPQSIETSIDQFFKRSAITQFIATEVKEKYRSALSRLVESIYKFIGTATCSIAYEQILTSYDIKHQPIINKNAQSAIFSGLDLQLATAQNNLKLTTGALVVQKGKTSKGKEITDSLAKMHAAFAKATAEYAKNLSEQKAENLRKESNTFALAADASANELNQTKVAMQLVQAELEEERRRAQELAAQKEALEKLALDTLDPSIITKLKVKTNNFTPLSKHISPQDLIATSSDLAQPLTPTTLSLDLTKRYQAEEEQKLNEVIREQQRIAVSTAMLLEEAKGAKVESKSLGTVFHNVMLQLGAPDSTEATLLRSILQWEKSALSYIVNHTSTASTSTAIARKLPTSLVTVFSFIGQKTGIGKMKTVAPELASALKTELHQILQQCILLTEQDRNFLDCVKALNQHYHNLTINHAADTLQQGTVSSQLAQIVAAVTLVAKNQFEYQTPQHNNPPGGPSPH